MSQFRFFLFSLILSLCAGSVFGQMKGKKPDSGKADHVFKNTEGPNPNLSIRKQTGPQIPVTRLKGTLAKKSFNYTLKNSEGVNIAIHTDEKGNFDVLIRNLEKGIYTLDEMDDIYLEAGSQLLILKSGDRYIFSGKGSVENNLLQDAAVPMHKLESQNGYRVPFWALLTEPAIFVPIVNEAGDAATQILDKSDNVFFKSIARENIAFLKRVKLSSYTVFYGLDSSKGEPLRKMLRTPIAERKPDHSKRQYEAYLLQFSKKLSPAEKIALDSVIYENWDFNNETLYKNSGYYREMTERKITFEMKKPAYKKMKETLKNDYDMKMDWLNREITNPYIRNYLRYTDTWTLIKNAKNTYEIDSAYQHYISTNNKAVYRKNIETVYQNLKSTQKNAVAPEFSFADSNGQAVSLKSLRGKYVYIDIWATWCAPCIAEIPDLKKLEALYKDKKISFVSISVDKQTDRKTWQNYIKQNDLSGIQLITDKDFSSDFIKKFGVTTIPRFLLVNPAGEIVDNDAKRPSNPGLKIQLDDLLR